MDDNYIEQTVRDLKSRIHTQRQALELTYTKKDVSIKEQVQKQPDQELANLADSLRPRRKSINDF